MGDVFDAMNRARREGDDGDKSERREEAGGLPPVDNVQPDNVDAEDTARQAERQVVTPGNYSSPQPAQPQYEQQPGTSALTTTDDYDTDYEEADTMPLTDRAPLGEPTLNGYAPEVVVHHDRGSLITEQYRAIRTQILARARNRRLQTHVVTSSAPEEGKTVTTVNLGITFTELRNQTSIIVEGDLRRPSFHKLFDRECTPGLVQLLRGDVSDIEQVIHPTVYDNLQFLPAGGKDFTHSTELLSSPRMAQVLDQLKDRYDHIFIDTPPVITVTDASIMGAICDQTLLVVRLHKTPTEAVDRAKRLLRAANCELAGVILTHMQYHIPRYLYRYL